MLRKAFSRQLKHSGLVPVLLSFALALRVIMAPMVLAPPEPGMIALCINGQIIHVAWDSELPNDATAHSDPCPFFGVTSVVEQATPQIIPPERKIMLSFYSPLQTGVILAQTLRANAPRAPPFLS